MCGQNIRISTGAGALRKRGIFQKLQSKGHRHLLARLLSGLSIFLLASCNRDVGDDLPELILLDAVFPPMYTVSGQVTGLLGEQFTIENANGDTVTIACPGAPCLNSTDMSFLFPETMHTLDKYDITVKDYPANPNQLCEVSQGYGVIGNDDIENVAITCYEAYRVTGSYAGVVGDGLKITNNGGDALTIPAGSGSYTFPTPLKHGQNSTLEIVAQPSNPWQDCSFGSSGLTITGNDPGGGNDLLIIGTDLTCTIRSLNVSGNISGLAYNGLVLNINGTNYTFNSTDTTTGVFPLDSGSVYGITIVTLPPGQQCTVYGGGNNVSSILKGTDITADIICSTDKYSAGGSITGLSASGLSITATGTLFAGGALNKSVNVSSGKASYLLATDLVYGDDIASVSITSQPAGQYCSFVDGSTTYTPSPTTVTGNTTLQSVKCTNSTISGAISGYTAPSEGLLIRYTQNPPSGASQEITISSGTTSYMFGTALNQNYDLTIVQNPYNFGFDCTFDSNGLTTVSGNVGTNVSITENITCAPLPNAATPTISMSGLNNTVTMSPGTAGDTVCYRTDGGNPQCSDTAGGTYYSPGGACASGSTEYTATEDIISTTTYKAVACSGDPSIDQSAPFSYTATIAGTAATPTFSPAAGLYNNDQAVTISSATTGATIYWNISGATMDCYGTNAAGSFTSGSGTKVTVITTGTTLYAIACKAGYKQSAQNSAGYTLQVATPVVTHNSSGLVTISGTTLGATYRYTTNGSTPSCSPINGNLYSIPFTYPNTNKQIRVIGCKSGYLDSGMATRTIRIAVSIRLTGLNTGSLTILESYYGNLTPYTFNGTGDNGAQIKTTYPAANYGYGVTITTQNTADPGPRCYLQDGIGHLTATNYSWTPPADFTVYIGCPVYYFGIPKQHWMRCPVGDKWDLTNGGCMGSFHVYRYCNTADHTCDTNWFVNSNSPLVTACNNDVLDNGGLTWQVPGQTEVGNVLCNSTYNDSISAPGSIVFPGYYHNGGPGNATLIWTGSADGAAGNGRYCDSLTGNTGTGAITKIAWLRLFCYAP